MEDRHSFVKEARLYYALAISIYFLSKNQGTARDIERLYTFEEITLEDINNPDEFLSDNDLFKSAIEFLVERRVIEEIRDRFGPTVYRRDDYFSDSIEKIESEMIEPFAKKRKFNLDASWLHSALTQINLTRVRLGIDASEFTGPDLEWSPLPLDRSRPEFSKPSKSLKRRYNWCDKLMAMQQIYRKNVISC